MLVEYNSASVPWIISVNNFRFSLISRKLCNLHMCIRYQYKGHLRALLLVLWCIKINKEMAGNQKLNIEVFIFTGPGAPVYVKTFSHSLL